MVVRAGHMERLIVCRVARSRDEGPARLVVLEAATRGQRVARRGRPWQETLAAGFAVAPTVVVGHERRRGAAGRHGQQRDGDGGRREETASDGVEWHGGGFLRFSTGPSERLPLLAAISAFE